METEQKFCSVFVARDFFSIPSFTSLQLQLSLDCRFDPCLLLCAATIQALPGYIFVTAIAASITGSFACKGGCSIEELVESCFAFFNALD